MKLIALLGAGALAAGTMTMAQPTEAQRYGYGHDYGRHDGVHRGDRYRPYQRDHFRGRGAYRGGYAYGHGPHRRGRLVCRVRRGHYGPIRRCFRIYR